ncbi:MAG TPA: dihydrofolate reductase family protein, partial [Ignavibacteriaceae bacterium]|jgi:dihydrofolate reductase
MRKIIVSNLVSLDGFISGPNGEIDWFISIADKEFEEYSVTQINSIDTMLFGRITYQLMESYWSVATTATDDQRIIDAMNDSSKIVFSKTIDKAEWKNSRLVRENMIEEVSELKKRSGKDIVIYGSGSLVSALTQAEMIDNYRLYVVPVILGSGKPLFNQVNNRINLELNDTRKFNSGLVLLHYKKKEFA